MNEIAKKAMIGAASGFVAAVAVDLNAWSKSIDKPFDWQLAVKRWIAGAVSGVGVGLGIGQL